MAQQSRLNLLSFLAFLGNRPYYVMRELFEKRYTLKLAWPVKIPDAEAIPRCDSLRIGKTRFEWT